ncbi:related to NOC4 Nucleolar, forms a complex with Nop14p that mediates maturation and nuclear export of 40S [Lecanosticta acicola]|uniref:Related to NOC4 Nucleolar, forms a complex with Nop14p that mediates maturation and nuclear export of 40S n=1 Tax=Lecanosticta acicola TaxID=111012 RepID=A0AAI9E8M6_9PEZI|nr:related to NOC4 Nucleolar, forms a complex with Nop14p that mediates maturation and nuclear export of 40S [Lecanosticta acicola]
MPGLVASDDGARKRKRMIENGSSNSVKSRKAPKTKPSASTSDDAGTRILLLEEQILESREHYNNIVELQKLVENVGKNPKTSTIAAVALCRAFSRLIAGEKLAKQKGSSEADVQIVQWLRARLRDYIGALLGWVGSPDAAQDSTALTLLMRLVKEETSAGSKKSDHCWRGDKSTFVAIVTALIENKDAEGVRQEFVDKYVEESDDVRFYTFAAVKQCLQGENACKEQFVDRAIDLLSRIEGVPESEEQLEDWYGDPPEGKHQLLSLTAHRKVAREAWLAVFRSTLSYEQRKKVLGITTAQILPWFTGHIELLADFLTDSFNQKGSMALMALSGIFNLMTQKNLDYPDFYAKLYSLLDEDLLHSKHRSRFFRLLETFMSSTHLPVAMVASYLKRLSRLALQSPPGGIVWIVPWVYNMLKQHPPCTFMLHRTYHPAHAIYANYPKYEEEGMDDPFDMSQSDPMLTGAIDSSLWELETLQSHYHPNVATLAKIMGEQFTKRDYQLEDFLDHSYASLIDAELGKEMKKAPVVEWEIPKRIMTAEEGGLNGIGTLLQAAIDAQ